MKLAACFGRACPDAPTVVQRMLAAQSARAWHQPVRMATPEGALGGVRTADRFSRVPSVYEAPRVRLLVAGVPISRSAPVAERLQQAIEGSWEEALRSLKELDGAFVAVLWSEAARKLAVVTDILGMQPVYLHRRAGLVAIASEVKALTSAGIIAYEPDPAGWGAFLFFGHTIADRTLAADIRRLPAASVTVYDPDSDRLSTESYWAWPDTMPAAEVDDGVVDGLGDQMVDELRACLAHHAEPVVCLSGGYDSRLLLAALDEVGCRSRALTLSHADEQGDLDGRLAHRIARTFRCDLDARLLDDDFFSSDAYLDYVANSGLASPSLYLFIAQLASCLDKRTEAIWDGIFPGCALFPVHQAPGGFDAYLHRAAPADHPLWMAAQRLFRREFAVHLRESFLQVLNDERARYADEEWGVSEFVVRNRTRHRIAPNPLQAFGNDAIALTPGIGKTFWAVAASIPTAAKRDHRLYRRLFERRFPKALRVPAVSAGTIDLFDRFFDGDVLRARLVAALQRHPRAASILARCRMSGAASFWKRSTHLDACLDGLDTNDGVLDAAAVDQLRGAATNGGNWERQRELLLYWWMSRRMFAT